MKANSLLKRRFFVEKTAVIAARPYEIFCVLTNLEEWRRWTPSITGISILDNDRPAPRVRIKVLQPSLPPAIWTIMEVDRDKSIVWEKRSLGLRILSEHFISEGSQKTTVTIRITYTGTLARLAWWLSSNLTRRYMTMEINGLKRECEKNAANDLRTVVSGF